MHSEFSVNKLFAKSLQLCPTLCDPIDSRLPCPRDSPGKNTGVGCQFPSPVTLVCLLNCLSRVQLFVNLWTIAHQALLSMDSLGKNTRVGCHTLLQGIFPTQELNPCLSALAEFITTSAAWGAQAYTLSKCPYFLLL